MEYSVEGKTRSTAWECHPHHRHLTDIKARAPDTIILLHIQKRIQVIAKQQ